MFLNPQDSGSSAKIDKYREVHSLSTITYFPLSSSKIQLLAKYLDIKYIYIYIYITEEPSMAKPLGLSIGTQTFGCRLPRNKQHRVSWPHFIKTVSQTHIKNGLALKPMAREMMNIRGDEKETRTKFTRIICQKTLSLASNWAHTLTNFSLI